MEKMKMESPDVQQQNVEKIGKLFPNCITEARGEDGKLKKAINFKLLKQMLSDAAIDGDEAYEFTWVGKKNAIVEANKPIRKTLRPCKEDSVNWDTTENIYIEGDNLEVLKLLQESYLGKVKMIYIDPPYNTGSDLIYQDDFKMTSEEYADESGELDEKGDRMFKNTDSNGRFHSDWCSMIYSRLMLARNLLSEDGAIFIHIDEHENYDLSLICNEIFGLHNELGTIIWDKRNPKGETVGIAYQHESILVYCKEITEFAEVSFSKRKEHASAMIRKVESLIKKYNGVNDKVRREFKEYIKNKSELTGGEKAYSSIDQEGNIYQAVSMAAPDRPETRSHRALIHPITGKPCPVPNKGWRFTDQAMDKLIREDKIAYGIDENTQPRQKYFLKDNMEEAVSSLLYYGGNGDAMGLPFDNPKPENLVKRVIYSLCKGQDDIVLDFFSGSATTAHAVMQLNAEDGGQRKFIMVQLPEKTDEKSEAYRAGYENICEIGKERIRRAAKKLHADHPDAKFDDGFRVFKLDSTNMNDVYYAAGDYDQDLLTLMEDNIKTGRTDLDLLFGCLLDWGIPLSLPYTSTIIDGCTVHNYNDGDLIACFDEAIPESVFTAIAQMQPLRAVFRDTSFTDSPAKINARELFKRLAPDTRIKVI